MRKPSDRAAVRVAVVPLVLAGVMLGCQVQIHPPTTIILVTIDTLRADHLGCYGYPRPTSPFLDRLAEEGIRFDRAFSASATTSPSHASLFTGLYPTQHGVRMNGFQRLDEVAPTLAELLQREGFATGGFASTQVHFGPARLDRGFTTFNEPRLKDLGAYRAGAKTVRRAAEWISRKPPEQKVFLWVHLFDPHIPYTESNALWAESEAERRDLERLLTQDHHIDLSSFPNHDLLEIVQLYDGEIRAADSAVAELFDQVERVRTEGETLWIVTSDHGEGLGNHRWLAHAKAIFNEQLRVPLILNFSSGVLGGRQVSAVVETVDLLPTIAELLDPPLGEPIPGLQGHSLVPLLLDEDAERPKPWAFAERQENPTDPPEHVVWELTGYDPGERWALQDATHKYILWTEGEDQLFDLRHDPYETVNLIGRGSPREEELRETLLAIVGSLRPAEPERIELDPETEDRLEALGYGR